MSSDHEKPELSNEQLVQIAAHEMRQPLIDIRNALANFHFFPAKFSLKQTHARIEEAVELALLNSEVIAALSHSEPKLADGISRSRSEIRLEPFLHNIRKMLRSTCDDYDFRNDNIEISVCDHFRMVRMSKPVIGMIAMNLLSNSGVAP